MGDKRGSRREASTEEKGNGRPSDEGRRQKTEHQCMGAPVPEREVKMQGVKLNRVQEFKYLGSTVQSDGNI